MKRDTNAELDALGLNVAEWIGMSSSEIDARFSGSDVRLVTQDGPLPAGWPREVRERTGPERIEFRLATADGEFRPCTGVEGSAVSRPDFPLRFGYLYTRRPLASPRVLVRPIAALHFDASGVCFRAFAALPEMAVRESLKRLDVEAGVARPESVDDVPAQRLDLALGLEPPRIFLDLPQFEADSRWRARERFTLCADPPGLRFDDASALFSIGYVADSDGGATATPSHLGERGTGVGVGRDGVRFAVSDAALTMLGFIDLFAGDLGLIVHDESRRRARRVRALLVASRTNAPEAALLEAGATLSFLLGSPLPEWAPSEDPALRIVVEPRGLRIVERGGAERAHLVGRVERDSSGGYFLAEIEDAGF